ncbi:MAG: AI-2E family transporter [Thermaerobacter sp.]|nr:AI-2E family transporter [Thermaerobacter sp.]
MLGGKRLIFLAAVALTAAALLYAVRMVLLPFVIAGIIAYLLSGPVRYLEARGTKRVRAVQLVYLAFVIALAMLASWVVPAIGQESQHLLQQLPRLGHGLDALIRDYDRLMRGGTVPESYRRAGDALLAGIESRVVGGLRGLAQSLLSAAPVLFALGVAPWIGYYLLRDAPQVRRGLFSLLPASWQATAAEWIAEVDRVLSGYLRGQALVALVVAALSFGVMTIFGLGFGAMVALVAGATDMVPFVGPFLGALPAVVIASGRSLETAAWVAFAFFLIHETEGNLLAPLLVGESIGLHPVLLLLAIFIGGELGGVTGVLLAAPVAGILIATARIIGRGLLLPRALR